MTMFTWVGPKEALAMQWHVTHAQLQVGGTCRERGGVGHVLLGCVGQALNHGDTLRLMASECHQCLLTQHVNARPGFWHNSI